MSDVAYWPLGLFLFDMHYSNDREKASHLNKHKVEFHSLHNEFFYVKLWLIEPGILENFLKELLICFHNPFKKGKKLISLFQKLLCAKYGMSLMIQEKIFPSCQCALIDNFSLFLSWTREHSLNIYLSNFKFLYSRSFLDVWLE